MTDIGFVGLGNMGGPMATHLIGSGYDLTAFDIDPTARDRLADAGATAATDGTGAVKGADVVFLSLPRPETVETFVNETESAFDEGAVLVDLTTSTPETTAGLTTRLNDRNVDVLGAPVSGGPSGANAGTLSVMVGGDKAVFEACRPLFEAFAQDIFHVGEQPGHGHAVKLLNNYLSFTALLATSEAVALGHAAGLDRETLVDVFSVSSGRNSATQDKIPEYVLTGNYDMGFTLDLMEKDVRLFTKFGESHDAPLLLGGTVRNLVGYARAQQGDDADMSRIYDFIEEMAFSE